MDKFDDSPKFTEIGNDVWIGDDVIIPGGITIATGAIVAAGSVVVKDVAPYAVVGGNPAKQIGTRFEEEEVRYLLESKWWELPDEKIINLAEYFENTTLFRKNMSDY